MKYTKVVEAIFLSRPNRFIANVLIDGIEETVHVRNTGRCKELLVKGAKVILEDCSHVPNRKTRYSLISVWKGGLLINMDSQIPNNVVFNALKDNRIKGLENLIIIKKEVSFGNSRYDLYFESENQKGFIEVKGVTLENDGIAMFPDAPTSRGTKHMLEMIEVVKEDYRGIIFFLIQMKSPNVFELNWKMDPAFSEAIKLANSNGVQILAYDSIVSKDGIYLGKEIDIDLNK
ncbi:MAG: DNA/RNA nuclease SfsA [Tissierella sp.]|uniref:DNA/RNA nuclease SfsA n=1 Tax=Tissierella sp. TaxID=41274 RepID=UPI003F993118